MKLLNLSLLGPALLLTFAPALSAAPPKAKSAPLAPATAADTPAVVVVREFLTDLTAGKYDAAYALLSAKSRQNYPAKAFTAGSPLDAKGVNTVPASLFGYDTLIMDTHNTLHYTFTLVGLDPANANAVLIRAEPPPGAANLPAVTVPLLTVSDPAAHVPRIDVLGSLDRALSPDVTGGSAQEKRAASQSNLKQLVLGIVLYLRDHEAYMPDADKWVDEIMPYVRNKAFFQDPSAPAGEKWSYAYNRNLSRKALDDINSPSATVILFESRKGVKNASDTGQSVPRPGRHLGGTDYVFINSHVKWFADGTKPSFLLSGK